MMKFCWLTLALLPITLCCENRDGKTCIQVYNKCPFTIWPGISAKVGEELPEEGGFVLNSGESKDVMVMDEWTAGRIWARTNCDENMNCDTGFCGNNVKCIGAGGQPPVSLAEFTLVKPGEVGREQDFYDVSLVDGYNIPVLIEPMSGSYEENNVTDHHCVRSGGCSSNLADPNMCPADLQKKNGEEKVVACYSACMKFNTDQYCCRGEFNTRETCITEDWPEIGKEWLKKSSDACPSAYNYAYHDPTGIFTCKGKATKSAAYKVQFC